MQILLAKISPLRKKIRFRICSHYPAAKFATSIVLATGNKARHLVTTLLMLS